MKILESRLQKKIIADLKSNGWLVNKIMLCSMNGWPDIFAMKRVTNHIPLTKFLFLEVKAKGKKPTPLQQYVHQQIELYGGGPVYVIDSWEGYLQLKSII